MIDLHELEAIKRLKHKYLRCLDEKLWDEMETVFTEDATAADRQPIRQRCDHAVRRQQDLHGGVHILLRLILVAEIRDQASFFGEHQQEAVRTAEPREVAHVRSVADDGAVQAVRREVGAESREPLPSHIPTRSDHPEAPWTGDVRWSTMASRAIR